MTLTNRLITSLGTGVLAILIAVALPVDAKLNLKLGQTDVNMTPAKNTLITLLGLGFVGSCLYSIKCIDEMEAMEVAEQERIRIESETKQRRDAMAAEAQLTAEQAFHQEVANRNVRAAFAKTLQQEVPAGNAPIIPNQPALPPQPQILEPQTDNFPERLGLNPKCFMIFGVPGAGKAMVMTHAARTLKRTKPHIKLVGVDPKNDPKETGNWADGFDHVFRKRVSQLDNHDFLKWVKGIVQFFKKLPDGKVLIFDEVTSTFTRWSRLDKQSFESFMVDYCTFLSSSGDSLNNYVWLIGQVPHASALGIDGGIRSIYKPVAIVSNQDKRATDVFLGTKFTPKPPGGIKEVYSIMDKSPRGRAIYDYTQDRWLPMPELHNFSGYDRDSGKQLS